VTLPAGLHPFTAELYDALGPGVAHDDAPGYLLARYLDGPGALLGDVASRVRDTDDGLGWERELDPDLTRAPAWAGQFVGVRIPDGTPLARARELIRERRAFRRGTPDALREAARTFLTGTRRVDLVERDGSAYRLRVITYARETPDPGAVLLALQAAKPAGLLLVHEVLSGIPYDERDLDADSYDELDALAPTYDQLDGRV
jgi:hypothetical protein